MGMTRDTLTREQIVNAAIDLLDAEGLEGLNMRSLGKQLGSAATAVYWHVGSKDNLIVLAGDQLWDEITPADLTAVGWQTAATSMASDLHAMFLRHPWLVQALGSFEFLGPAKARLDAGHLDIYITGGYARAQAHQAAATVVAFVLGNALSAAASASVTRKLARDNGGSEQVTRNGVAGGSGIREQLSRHPQPVSFGADEGATSDNSFEFGLQVILGGLAARLSPRSTPAGDAVAELVAAGTDPAPSRGDRQGPSAQTAVIATQGGRRIWTWLSSWLMANRKPGRGAPSR